MQKKSFTKSQVEALLIEKGIDKVIVSRSTLVQVLNISYKTIYNASRNGELPEMDRGIYSFADVCCWLTSKPRYLKSLV